MELNWLVFPTPESSYTYDKVSGELIFIPKSKSSQIKTTIQHIPCLLLRATSNSLCPKFAIFFHGNAEDINLAYEILNHIRFTLSVSIKHLTLLD